MLKKILIYLTTFALNQSVGAISNPTIFTLPVEFPTALKRVPTLFQHIRLYYCGQRIHPDSHQTHNKIFFSLLESRMVSHFWLIIIDKAPSEKLLAGNTIDYLKTDSRHSYKFYSMSLVAQESPVTKKNEYIWKIKQSALPASGRLPDNTIIMSYNPQWISRVEGGTALELPTIVLDDAMLADHESPEIQEAYEQQSIEIILSALDLNAIHEEIVHTTRYDDKVTRVLTT